MVPPSSPPPSRGVVSFHAPLFVGVAAFLLLVWMVLCLPSPFLGGTAPSLPLWRLPFSSALGWCWSGASALDLSFRFSSGLFMFVIFFRFIFLLVFPVLFFCLFINFSLCFHFLLIYFLFVFSFRLFFHVSFRYCFPYYSFSFGFF